MIKSIESSARIDIMMLSNSKIHSEVLRIDSNNVLNNSKRLRKLFIKSLFDDVNYLSL